MEEKEDLWLEMVLFKMVDFLDFWSLSVLMVFVEFDELDSVECGMVYLVEYVEGFINLIFVVVD